MATKSEQPTPEELLKLFTALEASDREFVLNLLRRLGQPKKIK